MPLTRRGLLLAGGGLAAAAAAPAAPTGIAAEDLRCEHLVDPLGIDRATPRLSWTCRALDPAARGVRQSAYRILVASSSVLAVGGEGDLWDSGRVESTASAHITYAGPALRSRQQCFWTVRLWDEAGRAGTPSAVAQWSMGLLDEADWQAGWIGLDGAAPPIPLEAEWIWGNDTPGSAPRYFRRSFLVPPGTGPQTVILHAAVGGVASLFVNGDPVGTTWEQAVARRFQVPRLPPGRNHIAVSVTPGAAPPGLALRLEIEDAGRQVLLLTTDGAWRTATGPIEAWRQPGLHDSAWPQARPLGATGIGTWGQVAREPDISPPARWLRKEFTLDRPLRRAVASFSGLGWSELHLNGTRVGEAMLSPGLTDYARRVLYVTHDVTALLRPGRNAVGAVLGNGRFRPPRSSARGFGLPRLRLRIDLDHADGSQAAIVSDASWAVTADGPIGRNSEYDGEEYDARREMPGWSRPGFDARRWRPAQKMPAPAGRLAAEMMEPIRVTATLRPVVVAPAGDGAWIYDFGQNFAGICRLRLRGPRGTVVTLRHAERLRPDGTLDVGNLRGALATDRYVLKGDGIEILQPRFTLHGFRYVELTGHPGPPGLDTLQGLVLGDAVRRTGEFACSDPTLNRLHETLAWTIRSNSRSIPTDCPQRDERQGWLGDRAEGSRGESFLFGNAAAYTKWLDDIADAQRDDGALSDVSPAYWPSYSDDAAWPATLFAVAGMLLDQYGDAGPLARLYPVMLRWIDHMAEYLQDDILPRDRFGDWGVPAAVRGATPTADTPGPLIGTAYFCRCLNQAHRFATLLGKEQDVGRLAALAQRVAAGFERHFHRADTGQYGTGSATSSLLPLAFGMVPAERRTAILDRLVREIAAHGGGACFGLLGAQWANRVLTRAGHGDVALRMLTRPAYPGLGYMLANGATTFWELWHGDIGDPLMNSGNHLMLAGDLGTWLYEDIAGIRADPARPGFAHAVLRPTPLGGLRWARARYTSIRGPIAIDWRQRRSGFTYAVTLPANTTATLHLPIADASATTEGGRPAATAQGVRLAGTTARGTAWHLDSGSYNFAAAGTLAPA